MPIDVEAQVIMAFNRCCMETIQSITNLRDYNLSDSPAFSQIGSIAEHLVVCIPGQNKASLQSLIECSLHPDQWLRDASATSSDWDGAPAELIKKARSDWKKYKFLLKALAKWT